MRQEELWEWRIKWLGNWTTTIGGATEEEIRKKHPEAIRILGSRCVRQVAESPEDLHRLSGILPASWQMQQLKNCEGCQLFGGWYPTQVGEKISYRTHGDCLRPGASRTIAQPEHGCAHWVEKQETVEGAGSKRLTA